MYQFINSRRPILFLLSMSLFLIETLPVRGQEKNQDASTLNQPATTAENVSRLDREINKLIQQEAALQTQLLNIQKQASDAGLEWKVMVQKLESIKNEQKKLNKQLKEQIAAAQKAEKASQVAQAAAAKAQKLAEEAIKKAEEQKKLAQSALEESAKLALLPDKTKKSLTALEDSAPPVEESIAKKQKFHESFADIISALEKQVNDQIRQRQSKAKEIEELYRHSGEWVSFTDVVAPIFHQHCLACHNSRNAQGRYNMTTYADILSTSESGRAIEPGDSENSSLCILVEDGSMPKDADPLTVEQIAAINKWIDLGARLEHDADPRLPLIRIMPRMVQPTPPEKYSTAIPVTALASDRQNQWLASSGYHEVLIWSLDGKLLRRISNVAERVQALDFHPDGTHLAVASGTPGRLGEVKVFDVTTGELMHDLFVAEDSFLSVRYSPSGNQLAAGGADGTIVLFDFPDDGTIQQRLLAVHADWVNQIDWSQDGKQLASASRDKTAKVFDVASGKLLITFNGHRQPVADLCWTAASQQIASTGADNRIRIWNTADGKEVRSIGKFGGEMTQVEMLNAEWIASGGAERKLRIHTFKDGKQVTELPSTRDWISSLTVSYDRKHLFAGDQKGVISIYQFSKEKADAKQFSQQWIAIPQAK